MCLAPVPVRFLDLPCMEGPKSVPVFAPVMKLNELLGK